MNQRILLIRTGGTIDATAYDDAKKPPAMVTTLPAQESLVAQTVTALGHGADIDMYHWGLREAQFVKDSQEFSPADIAALADIIRADTHRHIIITHGTDAMAHNARALQDALTGCDKTVVFVGAMVPLSMQHLHASDAKPALTCAMENILQQPAGIYVTGRDAHTQRLALFDPKTVEKDKPASRKAMQFTLSSR